MKKEEALQIEQKKPEEALGQVYWEWDRAGGEEEGHFPVSEDWYILGALNSFRSIRRYA